MARGVYRLVSLSNQMPGASGGYSALVGGIVKSNGAGAPYCIPNEYICASIGRFLGLPIPPCGIVYSAANLPPQNHDPHWFASLDFNIDGDSLPPIDASACVSALPMESTGLLLFDVVVANSDRHPGNLYVDRSAIPMRMSIFDHSHALCGPSAGQATARFQALYDRLGISGGAHTTGNRHCLLDQIADVKYFDHWVERIRVIPDFLIDDTCAHVIGLGVTEAEAKAAADFLKHRRDNLWHILDAHRAEFKVIKQWRLTA